MTASPMQSLAARSTPSLGKSMVPAAVTAMTANSGLYLLGVMAGIFPRFAFAPVEGAMTLAPILLVSSVAVAAGFGVYALLRRRAREPMRAFVPLALLVLLFSFVAPFFVPGWSAAEITLLNLMHVVAAGVTIGSLWIVARTE